MRQKSHEKKYRVHDFLSKDYETVRSLALNKFIILPKETSKWELIAQILRQIELEGHTLIAEGRIQIMPAGDGFLKLVNKTIPDPSDIYLPAKLICRQNWQEGMQIAAIIRPPRRNESYFIAEKSAS